MSYHRLKLECGPSSEEGANCCLPIANGDEDWRLHASLPGCRRVAHVFCYAAIDNALPSEPVFRRAHIARRGRAPYRADGAASARVGEVGLGRRGARCESRVTLLGSPLRKSSALMQSAKPSEPYLTDLARRLPGLNARTTKPTSQSSVSVSLWLRDFVFPKVVVPARHYQVVAVSCPAGTSSKVEHTSRADVTPESGRAGLRARRRGMCCAGESLGPRLFFGATRFELESASLSTGC